MSTNRAAELYYTIAQLTVILQLDERSIRRKLQAGAFSPPGADGKPDLSNIKNLAPNGSRPEIRVPASGVNFYLASHPYVPIEPIKARTEGELRRKVGRFSGCKRLDEGGMSNE